VGLQLEWVRAHPGQTYKEEYMWYARGSKLACTVLFVAVLTPLALVLVGLGSGVVKLIKNKEK